MTNLRDAPINLDAALKLLNDGIAKHNLDIALGHAPSFGLSDIAKIANSVQADLPASVDIYAFYSGTYLGNEGGHENYNAAQTAVLEGFDDEYEKLSKRPELNWGGKGSEAAWLAEQMVADLEAKVFPDREIRFLAVLPEAGKHGVDGRREARVM